MNRLTLLGKRVIHLRLLISSFSLETWMTRNIGKWENLNLAAFKRARCFLLREKVREKERRLKEKEKKKERKRMIKKRDKLEESERWRERDRQTDRERREEGKKQN